MQGINQKVPDCLELVVSSNVLPLPLLSGTAESPALARPRAMSEVGRESDCHLSLVQMPQEE